MAAGSVGREAFGSRAGFILAAAGSAVGLGNMWRFSYQASEGGGAAFVLLYIVMTILLGIPIMLAEFGLGRRGQLAPIGTLRKLAGRGWARVGYVFVISGGLILSYYSVIAGWTVRYAIEAITQGFPGDAAAHFGKVASGGGAVAFHFGFMAVSVAIVMAGIKGAGAGYRVYLQPDLAELMNPAVWRAAAAQAFFSLSLGMGGMLTFASYLRKDQDMPESATMVAFTDFGVAFVSGLVVFPVIFSLGLQAAVGESTVGALFIALPSAFDAMGMVGHVVGLFFFIALAVGAVTSAIALLEVVTASVIDEFGVSRRAAALGTATVIALLGILPATNLDLLGLVDKIAGELLLVAGVLVISVLAGWVLRPEMIDELSAGASPFWQRQIPRIVSVLRWFVPPVIVVVLFFSLKETIAAIGAFLAG